MKAVFLFLCRLTLYIIMGLNDHININSGERGDDVLISLGIFTLSIMGTMLLMILDILVYRYSFQSALIHLFTFPFHSSAGWFLGAAIIIAGWSDLKITAVLKRTARKLSSRRG